MSNLIHYYKWSVGFTVLAIIAGYFLAPAGQGLTVAWIVLLLSILETALSFDNAVVNAKILETMDEVWRKRFLTWGILIAVFGMRIVFPIGIVAIAGHMGPIEAVTLALTDEAKYAEIMHHAHPGIAAFGGAFLMLVFLKFFIDHEKDTHWLGPIESLLAKLGKLEAVQILLTGAAVMVISGFLPDPMTFIKAGMYGIATYVVVEGIGTLLGDSTGTAAKTGLGAFLYLEVLDASFSFDGVIGALALTQNMLIIALGLGAGAMFVRSMTIHMVEKGTLAQYRYLEHGAFWAIGALAVIMMISPIYETPEAVTGLISAILIFLAFGHSLYYNRSNRNAASAPAE